jgi:hypothetical protein
MKRFLLTASVLTLVGLGCSHKVMQPGSVTPDQEQTSESDAAATGPSEPKPVDAALPAGEQATVDPNAMPRRNPGDFVVYRFSGSYRKSPVTLTQRVLERKEGVLVVDVTLEDEGKRDQLRLRVHDVPGESDDVLSVARVEAGVLKPFGVAAYEALMAKTMLSVDRNEALIKSDDATIRVGKRYFDCVESSYRIRTGDTSATMTTLESSTFAWGDLGGQIQSADGAILYKAEVIDYGSAGSSPAGVVAAHADEDFDDDYAK